MELSINEAFELIRNCEMTELEMYNFLESVTSKFDLNKLKLIEVDFSVYYYPLKEEFEDNFTSEDIQQAIKERKEKNLVIEYFEIPGRNIDEDKIRILDIEQLLFPMEFYCCRQFYGLINRIINNHEDNESNKKLTLIKRDNNSQKSDKTKDIIRVETFKDIFRDEDWGKYIEVLKTTTPPLLGDDYQFLGSGRKHKGVICQWIKYLQLKGKIKLDLSRQDLSYVLNNEISNINLSTDGKIFDIQSKVYIYEFKQQLEKFEM
jgi:hypothetical protein